ncbi:23S rRNA (cytidine(2498)-2'-O)-methyltransferase RlmM [Marinimicrobium sp. ABcell2]|uniref:23S rRNA (cytidine(2498)-2'-O)-methyltransferase RlmM n=1 Tax=Marinimicrobium sp. ABcell2 TaxID=3069751 RepID=UPI0027B1485F|nr:23S rRNA (cytidine(2498)-2'-O)-methyltransferase RlmM [Marinimicrobium sp. ABcell2]MDQ2075239.1 23S rRNA (cytidine(2498)-2'-O)-methyltransferase RlmM [Marinimicrobium sp. ABcell2]
MNHLFLHCRPGFEKECAAEITQRAGERGQYGYIKTKDGSAFVLFVTQDQDGALALIKHLPFQELVFTRQWFAAAPIVTHLPPEDRVSPLLAVAETFPATRELVVETPDSNEGKELSALGRKFTGPFSRALRQAGQLQAEAPWFLHLLFLSGQRAYIGISPSGNRAPWPMGIPRLRQPKGAPSRATLKLEEAWHHFIPAQEWDFRLANGMHAVDLGAAPGGWTWQLVRRGMFVDAVDNGPMAKELMDSGLVTHQRVDGFLYRPEKPVHWLVCDIADKPARVASLISHWALEGYCREAVFNLKLPMKQRYGEVIKLAERMTDQFAQAGLDVELAFKQLYHDREEVTGHLRVY